MGNIAYPGGIDAFYEKEIDWESDDIRAYLVDSDYTADASHDFLSEVPAGARVAGPVALAGRTITEGVKNATSPLTFPAVTDGEDMVAVLIYFHTGVEGTSRLLYYIDTGLGFPKTSNGNDARINWSTGANKILKVG